MAMFSRTHGHQFDRRRRCFFPLPIGLRSCWRASCEQLQLVGHLSLTESTSRPRLPAERRMRKTRILRVHIERDQLLSTVLTVSSVFQLTTGA